MSPRSSACCSAGGTVVVINPARGDDRTRAEISALELPVIIGEPDDLAAWSRRRHGTTVITISDLEPNRT